LSEEKFKKDLKIKVPKDLSKIPFRDISLGDLNNASASLAMHHDMQGVVENAKNKKIPLVGISVDEVRPESFGELMVFFQYFVVYSAMLRHLNPFDQPEVEAAKKISLGLRLHR
jgi:glucose-6-phosphate isomerase